MVLQILTRFQTKKCNFPRPFSDQTSKIHTRCQTWHLGRNYVIYANKKNYSKPFRIRIFFSLSYSFGIETIKYVPRLRRSLENHTRFQTKMGKVCTHFQTKTAQKPYPMGQYITYMAYLWHYPPPLRRRCQTLFRQLAQEKFRERVTHGYDFRQAKYPAV